MSVGDSLIKQYEDLKKALHARESGLPDRLVVMVYSNDDKAVEAAVRQRLGEYGLDTIEEARLAHCEVVVTKLPWAAGRKVGINNRNDSRVMNELRGAMNHLSEDPASAGAGYSVTRPQVESVTHSGHTTDLIG